MYNKFAECLTALMKERNITQSHLAECLKVKQNTISQWAKGKREPDFDTLVKICILFGTTPTDILGYSVVKNQIEYGFLRDVVGNDKQFQKEQRALSDEMFEQGMHPVDMQIECEKLYEQYYKAYKEKFGF